MATKAETIGSPVGDYADRAKHFVDDAKDLANQASETVAEYADVAADYANTAGKKVKGAARSAADTAQRTADYFKENDLQRISDDALTYAKNNPVHAIIAAAVVGFFIGRMASRN
jgi:ElaB/YqjD/DUF883 family membrane-anchored ribosome-binding protein